MAWFFNQITVPKCRRVLSYDLKRKKYLRPSNNILPQTMAEVSTFEGMEIEMTTKSSVFKELVDKGGGIPVEYLR